VIFTLSSKRIRDEFQYGPEEYAAMFLVGGLGAFCGIGTTMLGDSYGRANM